MLLLPNLSSRRRRRRITILCIPQGKHEIWNGLAEKVSFSLLLSTLWAKLLQKLLIILYSAHIYLVFVPETLGNYLPLPFLVVAVRKIACEAMESHAPSEEMVKKVEERSGAKSRMRVIHTVKVIIIIGCHKNAIGTVRLV